MTGLSPRGFLSLTAALPLRVVVGAFKLEKAPSYDKTFTTALSGVEVHSSFGGWRHHLARWEAYHWILSRLRLLANPVPLPPQFGGAAKGKRLNGQARRLTSPHLEVLCRTSTGDYKAPLCCELLMKGLLFRALFCPPDGGKSGAAGKGEASAASHSAECFSCHMTLKANPVTLTL